MESVTFSLDIMFWVEVVIGFAGLLAGIVAFADASLRRPDAYPAADKQTKIAWIAITGICGIVLCEAYGLTADPVLRPYAQRAVNKVVTNRLETVPPGTIQGSFATLDALEDSEQKNPGSMFSEFARSIEELTALEYRSGQPERSGDTAFSSFEHAAE